MGGGAKLCGRSQTDGWASGEAKAKPRDGNDGGATGSLTQLPSAAADGRWTERCPAPSSAARSPPTIMPRTSPGRSEEHTSELQSLMRNSYAVFCLKKKTSNTTAHIQLQTTKHDQLEEQNTA